MERKLSDIRAIEPQRRFFDLSVRKLVGDELPEELRARAAEDSQARYEIAISSEHPVKRWFGTEVLMHDKRAVDMTYLKRGAAVLVDHGGDQVGVVETARLDDDKVLRGVIRFSRSARGKEVEQDVADKVRRFISVGYTWNDARVAEQSDSEGETWHVTRWTPMEVSIVAVPADPNVGVGRAAAPGAVPFNFIDANRQETTTMEKQDQPDKGNATAPVVSGGRDLAKDAADIVEMCAREGKGERAAAFIREGKSADEVGRILLADRRTVNPTELQPVVELSKKEQRSYSVLAALRGALAIAEGRGSEFTGIEREVHEELDRSAPKEYKRMGGVFIPMFTGKRAALDSATSGAASQLVFTEQREFIDLLRNLMVTTRLGATFLPGLVGPVGFPRQNGAASASWVAENPGSDVAESNLTVDLVTLSPKTIQATTAYTRQLLAQTSINVENLVRQDLATVHALKWDQTAIHGAGSATEPTGLYSIAGVNSHAVGGVPALADIVDMMTEVAKDNAFFGNLGWVTTPGMAGKLMQTLVAASAGSDMLWTGTYEDGRLGGYRASASNQISAVLGAGTNEHGMIFGNWSDLMIGTWGGFEVIVDPYSKKKRGVIEVTTFQMADIDVRHPESFVKGTGATIA